MPPPSPGPSADRIGRRLILRVSTPPTGDRLERLDRAVTLRDLLPGRPERRWGPDADRRIRRLAHSTAPAALAALHAGAKRRVSDPGDANFADRERDAALEALATALPGLPDVPRIDEVTPDGRIGGQFLPAPLFVRLANASGLAAHRQSVAKALVDPNEYFVCTLADDEDPARVKRALRRFPGVIAVWSEPVLLSGPAPERFQLQAGVAPFSLGVAPLRALGFDGRGVRVVVVEQGFQDHVDLPPIPLLGGLLLPDEAWHGTATVGVLCALADNGGVTGLAPGAEVSLVSPWQAASADRRESTPRCGRCGCPPCPICRPDGQARSAVSLRVRTPEIADTIISMVHGGHVGRGDILLIELQMSPEPGSAALPLDCFEAYASAVAHAALHGVVVVEAAGNGGLDLDTLTGTFALRETGALLIGAAAADLGVAATHGLLAGPFGTVSNHGNLVVQYGPGERVTTTGGGASSTVPDDYQDAFSGTSSASAVVAGGLAALQSAWAARRPAAGPMTPVRFDGFGLVDWALPKRGAEPAVVLGTQRVGVQSDLRRVVRDTWRLTLRVHLEDIVGRGMPRSIGLSGQGAALEFAPAGADLWAATARLVTSEKRHMIHTVRGCFTAFAAATLPTPALWFHLPEAVATLSAAPADSSSFLSPALTDLTLLPQAVVLGQDVRKHGAVCLMARIDTDEDPMASDDELSNFWSYVYHVKYDPKLLVRQTIPGRFDADHQAVLPFYLAAATGVDAAFDVFLSVTLPAEPERANVLNAALSAHGKLRLRADDSDTRIPLSPNPWTAGDVFPASVWKTPTPLAQGVFPAYALRACVLTLDYTGDVSLKGVTVNIAQRLQGQNFTVGRLRWTF